MGSTLPSDKKDETVGCVRLRWSTVDEVDCTMKGRLSKKMDDERLGTGLEGSRLAPFGEVCMWSVLLMELQQPVLGYIARN